MGKDKFMAKSSAYFKGQSYEIKIRKTGNHIDEKNIIYKSIIRVGFQERHLQYIEKEQIREWQSQRYGERILEIDLPQSYGILAVNNCPLNINQCEFIWDSHRDVGVFIKINCISTEFTAKKHGGEKGVPFRILIETFLHDSSTEQLHFASCQVKVFKPKGADRKHKTDREKMCKRLQIDKEKYHPQYEYTIFRNLSSSDIWAMKHSNTSAYLSSGSSPSPSSPISNQCSPQSPPLDAFLTSDKKDCIEDIPATSTTEVHDNVEDDKDSMITCKSTAMECISWLQKNMFSNYIKEFADFTGIDLLNLSRADLMDICGPANGIRLYNALHIRSAFTIYVRLPTDQACYAIYLRNAKVSELSSKVKEICGLAPESEWKFYISGPSGMPVVVTDEVVHNMSQDTVFLIEYMNQFKDPYGILLKNINK